MTTKKSPSKATSKKVASASKKSPATPAAKPEATKKPTLPTFADEVPFTRLQMKLMVLERLIDDKIIPRFRLSVVEKAVGKKLYVNGNWVLPDDDFFGMIPEVRDWLFCYPLKREWVEKIETISWGAGTTLMNEVAPNWDGEDGLFDITAKDAVDLPLLPNLKQVKAGFDVENAEKIVAAFAAQGVKLLPYWP